jgi:hypothetical protein
MGVSRSHLPAQSLPSQLRQLQQLPALGMNHPQLQRLLLDAVQGRKLLDPQLKLRVLSQQLFVDPRLGSQIILDLDNPGEL